MNASDFSFFQNMVEPDRFSTGESNLNLHSKDISHHGPYLPEAVLWPVSDNEIARALAYANDKKIPVTAWGAGSSLEGNPLPVHGGLVLDMTKMSEILAIRAEDFQADVQPGVVYQDLNEKLRHQGLFFPPDPGARATLGGMIANNASGTRTVKYGSTRDYVLRLKVVLASGQIMELGCRAAKTSSGYDLLDLFVGSEGTLGVVTEATVKLIGAPEESSAALVSFKDIESAGRTVFDIMRSGLDPAAMELLDKSTVLLLDRVHSLGLGDTPALLMEFHGPSREYLGEVLGLAEELAKNNGGWNFRAGLGRDERDRLWHARHKAGETMIQAHPGAPPLIVDAAVPIGAFPDMIAAADALVKKGGVPGYIFAHAGDGNLHVVLMGRTGNQDDWDTIHRISEAVVERALSFGGTATGEHGVGLGKRKYMAAEHGESLDWMKKVKELFDPNGILNPGKMF